MGANQSATTSPIPQYPPNPGPVGYQGYPGAGPQGAQAAYYRNPPQQFPEGGYGPPPQSGRYGPPPPRGRMGPPPPPGGYNRPPPVRLGDRHYMDGPPGGRSDPGPSGPPPGLQPRDNYPPNIRRILDDDDDDIFADDADVFLNKPRKRHDFSSAEGVEDFVFRKMDKNRVQPERDQRYYSRPPANTGPSGGGVQASREPQYRAEPQIVHLQPRPNEKYEFSYDHQTGRLNFDPKPGLNEIGGYRVESINLPPVFDNQGGSGSQVLGFPSRGAVAMPGAPQVISGPYGGGSGPFMFPAY